MGSKDSNRNAIENRNESIVASTSASPVSKMDLHPGMIAEWMDIPCLLGPLGEVKPIIGQAKSWEWLLNELKSFPLSFSQSYQTSFIHASLLPESRNALRTAYSLCLAYQVSQSDSIRNCVFQSIAAEVNNLLNAPVTTCLMEELSRLQALVLYQTLRLLEGDLEQRITADLQEGAIENLAVSVLSQSTQSLGMVQQSHHTWVLAEAVRRTAVIAFMLYCVYSIHTLGSCTNFPTMASLPISSRPELWDDGEGFQPMFDAGMSYQEYSDNWVVFPWRKLKPFERMLLIPCKGFDKVESFTPVAGLAD